MKKETRGSRLSPNGKASREKTGEPRRFKEQLCGNKRWRSAVVRVYGDLKIPTVEKL